MLSQEKTLHTLSLHQEVGNFVMLFILWGFFLVLMPSMNPTLTLPQQQKLCFPLKYKQNLRELLPSNFWNVAMNPVSYSVSPLYEKDSGTSWKA